MTSRRAARRWAPLAVLALAVEGRRTARHPPERDASIVAALLDRVARQCASGMSLGRSLSDAIDASPLSRVFAPTAAALHAGETVQRALDRQPPGHPDIALATHVLRLCAAQGGNIAESLDRAAATLRERRAAAEERYTQSAQARLSARVLTVLPLAFGGWTCATTASVRRFVLTPAGTACVVGGVTLNVGGWLLMARVVRNAS